jgi:hypothetical protein
MRMDGFCRVAGGAGKPAAISYCALPRAAAWSGSAANKLGRDEYL